MLCFKNIYSDFAFAGNPLALSIPVPSGWSGKQGVFMLKFGGTQVYEGRFLPPVTLNVADIAEAASDYLPEVPEGNTEPLVELEDIGSVANRFLEVKISMSKWSAGELIPWEEYASVFVISGGVSKQNLRKYAKESRDAFGSRFLNYHGNFFLTGHKSGWRVIMSEMEVAPLYFIASKSFSMEIFDSVSGTQMGFNVDFGIYALDIDALRRAFFLREGVLPSHFDVVIDGKTVTSITIEKSEMREDLYVLEYRNSLGVMERFEVAEGLQFTPEESEIEPVYRYDPATEENVREWQRGDLALSATVDTAVMDNEDIPRLMDLLSSEEVRLIIGREKIPVHASTEELTFDFRPESPQVFTLRLTPAESDRFIMSPVKNSNDRQKPKVFTDIFNAIFY